MTVILYLPVDSKLFNAIPFKTGNEVHHYVCTLFLRIVITISSGRVAWWSLIRGKKVGDMYVQWARLPREQDRQFVYDSICQDGVMWNAIGHFVSHNFKVHRFGVHSTRIFSDQYGLYDELVYSVLFYSQVDWLEMDHVRFLQTPRLDCYSPRVAWVGDVGNGRW